MMLQFRGDSSSVMMASPRDLSPLRHSLMADLPAAGAGARSAPATTAEMRDVQLAVDKVEEAEADLTAILTGGRSVPHSPHHRPRLSGDTLHAIMGGSGGAGGSGLGLGGGGMCQQHGAATRPEIQARLARLESRFTSPHLEPSNDSALQNLDLSWYVP